MSTLRPGWDIPQSAVRGRDFSPSVPAAAAPPEEPTNIIEREVRPTADEMYRERYTPGWWRG